MKALIAHLNPTVWKRANRLLIKKACSEFAHECILKPTVVETLDEGWNRYELTTADGKYTYQFKAILFGLEHWHIDELSLIKLAEGKEVAMKALEFIVEFQETLGIPDRFLATYLEEITSTLMSTAFKLTNETLDAKALSTATFQEVEHAMAEGHPCFVANNGRIGFTLDDYHKYAPEADTPFQIYWVAGHKSAATYTAMEGYDYAELMRSELGSEKVTEFEKVLIDLELDVQDYLFMPVHPWQWNNKLVHVFAEDIAGRHLVFLGKSNDEFSAQQSIRTLYNKTHPEKLYTKTALSILNMGFVRGLSPYYMQSTPHITTWIDGLLGNDSYLQNNGFTMLGEVATIGFQNRYYEALGKTNPHNKMLSALWRESPYMKIGTGQTPVTMASLLHLDAAGNSLLVEYIKQSGIGAKAWIQQYLKAYLSPLIHCFYHYELVFMPHGENLLLVLENAIPQYVLMKDITEEVIVFNEEMHLPEHADRLFTKTSDRMKLLSIFTDVFDCIFRFIPPILATRIDFEERDFWKLVAECIHDYQASYPELQAKFDRYDMFVPTFDRCCLNKLQLANTKQMLNLADPIESLKLDGVLQNPIAGFSNKESLKTQLETTTV